MAAVLVLEVLVLALEAAWGPGPRAGAWACEAAEAGPAAVLPGCVGEVAPRLEAVWGPMAGMAGVGPCEAAEAGPAGVLRQGTVRGAQGTAVVPGWGVGEGCPGSSCSSWMPGRVPRVHRGFSSRRISFFVGPVSSIARGVDPPSREPWLGQGGAVVCGWSWLSGMVGCVVDVKGEVGVAARLSQTRASPERLRTSVRPLCSWTTAQSPMGAVTVSR